jgi:dodecin
VQERKMPVNKVIELMSESNKSWEDAAQKAVDKAAKSIKGIRSVWIQDMSAKVDNKGKLEAYRVTCKLSFEVK